MLEHRSQRQWSRMEPKNILMGGVWAFTLIWLVGMLLVEGDMLSSLVIFFVAIAVSVGVVSLPSGKPG